MGSVRGFKEVGWIKRSDSTFEHGGHGGPGLRGDWIRNRFPVEQKMKSDVLIITAFFMKFEFLDTNW